jgi:WXXGXW repeat (2 copies)
MDSRNIVRKLLLSALFAVAVGTSVTQAAEVVVQVAPPRVIVEHRGVRPSREHVWIGGYHRWDGNAYAWQQGRWEAPPRPHAVWVAPRWQHRHDGYVMVEGHWR